MVGSSSCLTIAAAGLPFSINDLEKHTEQLSEDANKGPKTYILFSNYSIKSAQNIINYNKNRPDYQSNVKKLQKIIHFCNYEILGKH